jgi:hypothetical protein
MSMPDAASHRIFVSYDTREQEWANFVKEALQIRFPGVPAFVAVKDIKPGDHSFRKMLEQELLHASAVIPICSRLSQSSPWLYWEAASAWAREKPYFPLYLGLEPHEFKGGPMNMLQGRMLDSQGINDTFAEIAAKVLGQSAPSVLTTEEESQLETLKRLASQGALDLDVDGPSCVQEVDGQSLRRVRVTNKAHRSISNVEVKIARFSPVGAPFLPARLQRMHRYEQPFMLHASDESYVDVITWYTQRRCFTLHYHPAVEAPNNIPVQQYELDLSVSGQEAGTLVRTFIAEVNAANQFTLTAKK